MFDGQGLMHRKVMTELTEESEAKAAPEENNMDELVGIVNTITEALGSAVEVVPFVRPLCLGPAIQPKQKIF